MSGKLTVKVSSRKDSKTGEYYEGAVTMPGLQGKLTKADGTTRFSNVSAASQAAKSLAKRLGWESSLCLECPKTPVKQAAKKSAKKTTTTKKSCGGLISPPWLAS